MILRGIREIHSQTSRDQLLPVNFSVASVLIDKHNTLGMTKKASEFFDPIANKYASSENTVIPGYSQEAQGKKAVFLHRLLQLKVGQGLNDSGKVLQSCTINFREGSAKSELTFMGSCLQMLNGCRTLMKANEMPCGIPVENNSTLDVLIRGRKATALNCFKLMQSRRFHSSFVEYVPALREWTSIGFFSEHRETDTQLSRNQSTKEQAVIVSCLVDMQADEYFDGRQKEDSSCWNALITDYAHYVYDKEALECLELMGKTDFSLDVNNFVYLLEASGRLGDVVKGQQIHAHIYSQCLMENSIELGNALINMYVHCDALEKAQDVFDELPVKDLLSWVAITSGYALHGHGEECLACFERMHSAGFSPNATMCGYALKSCGNLGAACTGQKIHADIVKKGILEDNDVLTLALLVMYANCGLIAEAQQMFEELPVHDVIAWTALIAVYARFEKDDIVLSLFNEMIEECVEPDIITLAVVSDSCYRTGCMEYIQTYSRMESIGYTINPSVSVGNDIIKLSDIAVYSDFLTNDLLKEPSLPVQTVQLDWALGRET